MRPLLRRATSSAHHFCTSLMRNGGGDSGELYFSSNTSPSEGAAGASVADGAAVGAGAVVAVGSAAPPQATKIAHSNASTDAKVVIR